jgi:hypothetical protein
MGSGIYHRYRPLFFGYQQARQTSFPGVTGIYSVSVLYTFFAYPLARYKHFVLYISWVDLASALDQDRLWLLDCIRWRIVAVQLSTWFCPRSRVWVSNFDSRKATCHSLLQYYRYLAIFKLMWLNHSCIQVIRTKGTSQYSWVPFSSSGHSRTLIRQARQRRAFRGRAFRVANNSSLATNNIVPHLDTSNSPTHTGSLLTARIMAGNMLKGEPL